jgi:hypothetical protein
MEKILSPDIIVIDETFRRISQVHESRGVAKIQLILSKLRGANGWFLAYSVSKPGCKMELSFLLPVARQPSHS